MRGKMLSTVQLLGTSLELKEGQEVELTPATNLPPGSPTKYFARPADGKWADGIDRNPEDSVGVWRCDVEVEGDPMRTFSAKILAVRGMRFDASNPETWTVEGLTMLRNPVDCVGGAPTGYCLWANLQTRPATDEDFSTYYDQRHPIHFTDKNGQKVMPTAGTRAFIGIHDGDYIVESEDGGLEIWLAREFEEKFKT